MKPAFLRIRLLGFSLATLVMLGDQISKSSLLAASHAFTFPIRILPFFNIVLVWNRGISFGLLGASYSWAATALTCALSLIVAGLAIWLCRAAEYPIAIALACVIGGATGNIIDRLRYGAVTDFLDFHLGVYHWPAFNIADSAIFIGVVILLWGGVYFPRPQRAG